jgi:hypothetical protein
MLRGCALQSDRSRSPTNPKYARAKGPGVRLRCGMIIRRFAEGVGILIRTIRHHIFAYGRECAMAVVFCAARCVSPIACPTPSTRTISVRASEARGLLVFDEPVEHYCHSGARTAEDGFATSSSVSKLPKYPGRAIVPRTPSAHSGSDAVSIILLDGHGHGFGRGRCIRDLGLGHRHCR